MQAYFFFISLEYLPLFIFYLSGGKTYQPALVITTAIITMEGKLQ